MTDRPPGRRKRFGPTKKRVKPKVEKPRRQKVDDPIFVPRRGLLHHAAMQPFEPEARLIKRADIDKPKKDK